MGRKEAGEDSRLQIYTTDSKNKQRCYFMDKTGNIPMEHQMKYMAQAANKPLLK